MAKVDPNSNISEGAKDILVKGALTELNPQEMEKVLVPIYAKQPELRTAFLPFIIDAQSDFSNWAYIWLAVGLLILIIAVYTFGTVFNDFGKLETSSALKKLSVYGKPKEVAAMIDAEVLRNHEKIGGIYILPTWIINPGTFSTSIQHIEDIVWLYKKTTKHSVNLIPAGKTHEVVLHNVIQEIRSALPV